MQLDNVRCRYADCPEQHPTQRDADERVTCVTCRTWMGLPSVEEADAAPRSPIRPRMHRGDMLSDEPGDSLLTVWERHFGIEPPNNLHGWMDDVRVNTYVGLLCRDAIRRTWELLRTLDPDDSVVEPILNGLERGMEIIYFG